MSILTIARDQAADLLRRRYLIVIFVVSLAIIGMWVGYVELMRHLLPMAKHGTPGANPAQTKEAGEMFFGILQIALHAIVGSIAAILALGLMCFSVTSEISKGTIRMVLSRPVKRYEFFLGKWLGCVSIVFVYALLAGAMVCAYTYYEFGTLQPVVMLSLGMMFLKAVVVGSTGMALAMLMRPIGGLLVAYLAAGETFLTISGHVHGHVKVIMRYLFYILPSYKAFDQYSGILNGTMLSGTQIAYRVAYCVLICALMLIVGSALFQRRDLA
jgi:ABC-type transport system involved in multi-copper enzyme maturation permease subunit